MPHAVTNGSALQCAAPALHAAAVVAPEPTRRAACMHACYHTASFTHGGAWPRRCSLCAVSERHARAYNRERGYLTDLERSVDGRRGRGWVGQMRG